MYGVKLYSVPKNLNATISLWHELGFNTLFIGQDCKTDSDFLEQLQHEGFFVNLIEPVFLGDEKTDPTLFATTKDGSPAVDGWVRFVCPTNREWLESFYNRFEKDCTLNVNSLSLDFIRFFQFWEVITPENNSTTIDTLKETCFCPRCRDEQKAFLESGKGKDIGDWRCSIINDITKSCREIMVKSGESAQCNPKILGLHAVPWTKSTFNGAVSKILGQNLATLSEHVNFFTPMAYHHMMKTELSYIKTLVQDMETQVNKAQLSMPVSRNIPIIPSVQLKNYYRDEKITLEENRQTIETALEAGHGNVIYFQWTDIEENPEIINILKNGVKNETNS